MDTSFAPPQPSAALLWNDVVSEGNSHSTTLFPPFCAVPQDPTAYYAEPSAWSVSAIKRCIDLFFAVVALLLFWPLLLLAALLVRYKSPGPVIFRQKRVGRDGVLFTVFKFRTMAIDAQEDGPSLTKRGDPRVTRFGGFLRKYKLDELPQLINIIRGDMSLVGPRPALPWEAELFDAVFFGRFAVTPGLTGLWQVSGRNMLTMKQGLELDLEYVRRQSLVLDLWILVKTLPVVISTHGAL